MFRIWYSNQSKKECIDFKNDHNCLTQANVVRFSKFKSLQKADRYPCMTIVGAHLHTMPLELYCTAPEDNYILFNTICIMNSL